MSAQEPMIEPDGMADDLGWKTVTTGAAWLGFHRSSLSNPGQLDNTVKTFIPSSGAFFQTPRPLSFLLDIFFILCSLTFPFTYPLIFPEILMTS